MASPRSNTSLPTAVAVYCGSASGNEVAFQNAATSLGKALARAGRPLVYGGGSKGLMGLVSKTVKEEGGHVTGVIPMAMVRAGGEGSGEVQQSNGDTDNLKNEVITVSTMHERKIIMASRSGAFMGLPGGYGTFEEIMEVTTWTQLRIHQKPVFVLNVLKFFEPLRAMIQNAVASGFIQAANADLLVFVEGPEDSSLHEEFDWGSEALKRLDEWKLPSWGGYQYVWGDGQAGGVYAST